MTKEDILEFLNSLRTISIRTGSIEEETIFDMTYNVVPIKNERAFYTTTVFSLIAFSLIISYVSLIGCAGVQHLWIINSFKIISDHINTLLGGIITISLISIGFMKSSFTNRTRFWFLIPIIISAIGFFFQSQPCK